VNLSQDFHVTYSGLYIAATGFAGYTVSVESLTINCSERYSVQVSLIFILIARVSLMDKKVLHLLEI